MFPLLIISGPVGVGKTAVAGEVGNVLEERGIAHTVIDLDQLASTYPRPHDDRLGNKLALANLRDVWINCVEAGSTNLVVARVVESEHEVGAIASAVSATQVVVVRLRASVAILHERIRQREVGSSLEWHLERAAELAASLDLGGPPALVIDTDRRTLRDIAAEIVSKVGWYGEHDRVEPDTKS